MAKVLLLDDEPDALEWMTAVLAGLGHDVQAFRSGRQALARLREWRPDLIVSDILMPEMDGLGFARLVRSLHGPPVMFISIAVKQAEAILAGAVGYVQKPATASEVRAAVQQVLGNLTRRAVIMIVDDDEETRELFVDHLGSAFETVEAENGQEALARLHARRIDLVVTDFHMPEMNGLELIRAMRAEPKLQHVPVIVQTSDRVALASPVWRELEVAYQMDKLDFVHWLHKQIDAKLPDDVRHPNGSSPN